MMSVKGKIKSLQILLDLLRKHLKGRLTLVSFCQHTSEKVKNKDPRSAPAPSCDNNVKDFTQNQKKTPKLFCRLIFYC